MNLVKCVLIGVVILGMGGCGITVKDSSSGYEYRHWNCEYTETYTINTEPLGCKVYIQDGFVGISPVTGDIVDMEFKVHQTGWYRRVCDWDNWSARRSNHRRAGQTNWNAQLECKDSAISTWVYNIRVFKDGYEPAERKVVLYSNIISQINKGEVSSGGKLSTKFNHKQTFLIVLKPIERPAVIFRAPAPTTQTQQNQQTVVIGGGNDNKNEAQKTGNVLVTCEVEYCSVYLDGIFVGNSPAHLTLKEGIHIIEVKKAGYTSFKTEIRVLAGSDLVIRAVLK